MALHNLNIAKSDIYWEVQQNYVNMRQLERKIPLMNNKANTCSGARSFLIDTSFWLGSAWGDSLMLCIYNDSFYGLQYHATDDEFGIRPVIVI